MDKISIDEIGRYLSLQNLFAESDPYMVSLNKKSFIKNNKKKIINDKLKIYILVNDNQDIGYIRFTEKNSEIFIEELFLKNEAKKIKNYKKILQNIEEFSKIKKIIYTALLDDEVKNKALMKSGFKLEREYLEYEKELDKKIEQVDDKYSSLKWLSFFELSDPEGILFFINKCLDDLPYHYDLNDIRDIISKENYFSYLLYNNDQPVAVTIANISSQRNMQEHKKIIYIEELAVLPCNRKKGYGEIMLREMLAKGWNKGINLARIHVYKSNNISKYLCEKLGFEYIKTVAYWKKL